MSLILLWNILIILRIMHLGESLLINHTNENTKRKIISIIVFCIYVMFLTLCVITLGISFDLLKNENENDNENYKSMWCILLIETILLITDILAVFVVFKRKIQSIINREYINWPDRYIICCSFKILLFFIISLIYIIRHIRSINDNLYFEIMCLVQCFYQICFSIYFVICIFSLPKSSEESISNIFCDYV